MQVIKGYKTLQTLEEFAKSISKDQRNLRRELAEGNFRNLQENQKAIKVSKTWLILSK